MFENVGSDPAIECLTLFFGTFLQEDIAIVTGGLFVVKHHLPIAFAWLSLYTGMVVSDLLVYGLGAAARQIPLMRRYFIDKKVEQARKSLKKYVIPTVAFSRFLPGLLFPTFLACGWVGIPFIQFAVTTIIAAAVYTVTLLCLVIILGGTVIHHIGFVGWVILFCIVIALLIHRILRPLWHNYITKLTRQTLFRQQDVLAPLETHEGIPPLDKLQRKVSLSERIPPLLFYFPIVVQWIALGLRYRSLTLPTIANPLIEAGGLWGESKSNLMGQISEEQSRWIAALVTVQRGQDITADLQSALEAMSSKGLDFPIVVKPDIGWQGYGVRMLHNENELRTYIADYPVNQTIIIQKPIMFEGEAGVFYIRFPHEEKGRITSLTLRYLPHLVGDGKSTVRELILKDNRTNFKKSYYFGDDKRHMGMYHENLDTVPADGENVQLTFIASLRVGGLYRNGKQYITQTMNDRFDAIARSIPEFYFGRFDIRFKSIERLQAGEDFAIFEINGAGSEAIHIWDADTSILEAYKELFIYQSLLFEISNRNRVNGFKPISIKELYRFTLDYQRLLVSYPPSK